MEFEFINVDSHFFPKVVALGKKYSGTLGFMPDGGFVEHIKKKCVLVAKEDDILCGYLLFRISKKTGILSVTHLCVDESHRGKKIAVKLLNIVRDKFHTMLSGMLLSCREDYSGPSKLWKNYGFIAKDKIRSRSFEEHYLIKWWYSFNKIDLFSISEKEKKHQVLLDMNVLIKLRDNTDKYIKSLLDDRFVDQVQYFYANEFYNEIIRDSDKERVKQTKAFVQRNFEEVKINFGDSTKIYDKLKEIFNVNKTNDSSDIRQISDCIAGNIGYFITKDKAILNNRSKIENLFDVAILSPEEFILRVDEFIDDSGYNPERLAGATHTTSKVYSEDLNPCLNQFLLTEKGEHKSNFEKRVHAVIENLPFGTIQTVTHKDSGSLAFWGYVCLDDRISVRFIRTIKGGLELTLFTQLLYEIINLSISNNKNTIEISNDYFEEGKIKILTDFGFVNIGNTWQKITINDLINSSELRHKYPIVNSILNENEILILDSCDKNNKLFLLYLLERKLFPLKFIDLDIPCYIIPIKRFWAGQLFDKYNSGSELFGANPQKIWNRENIYYRSIKPVSEEFPARILWYVSATRKHSRQKSILATSYLDNVTIDNVKSQFKNYKKYGIYEWEHLYQLAGEDDTNQIKAIKFSDTEVFENEISFEKITQILKNNNYNRNTFVSPLKVDSKVFNDIYKLTLNSYA